MRITIRKTLGIVVGGLLLLMVLVAVGSYLQLRLIEGKLAKIVAVLGYLLIATRNTSIESGRIDEIVVVLLDLTMPHLDGEETFRELRRLRPDVRVILSSGYNEQETTSRFAGKGLAGFLQKPYGIRPLMEKIRQVLEAPPS